MKKLFLLLAGLALIVSTSAYVTSTPTTPLNGGTNNVALNATNTYTKSFNCTRDTIGYFGFSGSFVGTATTTQDVVFVIAPGALDATTNYSNVTGDYKRITYTANGTTPVYFNTNVFIGAFGWARLIAIENKSTNTGGYLTNITVRPAVK